jgi:hypothetical protein
MTPLEVEPAYDAPLAALNPETAVALALAEAELLKIQAGLIAAGTLPDPRKGAAFRDMSPVGQRIV